MKFSIIYEAQMADISHAAEIRCFKEIVEQSLLAERCGFDCVWAVEHTALTWHAHMSAPETFLAYLAGRTTRLHLGHGVVCLPPAMNHPVKVAERIAMLDILSDGRVHFGVGRGGSQQESGTFGYDIAKLQPMIDEAMYLIPRIFVEEEIEHHGEFINIPRRPIRPKPFQQPHPPMYMACTNELSVLRAGERGMGALVMGFAGPADVANKNRMYREAFRDRDPARQVGFRPTEHLAALCPAVVLADRQRARRIGLRGQRFFAEAGTYWYAGGSPPGNEDPEGYEAEADLERTRERNYRLFREHGIEISANQSEMFSTENAYGGPPDAIAHVEKLHAAGADEILFLVQMGTIPHAAILETIQNIGDYVIPHFRAGGETAPASGQI
jgi:alkanesulfonate monooxygenase SsuD/methylene tetrahydromethanopterin reductase-like flavin-dependent oxidoreductase (luciferase family)